MQTTSCGVPPLPPLPPPTNHTKVLPTKAPTSFLQWEWERNTQDYGKVGQTSMTMSTPAPLGWFCSHPSPSCHNSGETKEKSWRRVSGCEALPDEGVVRDNLETKSVQQRKWVIRPAALLWTTTVYYQLSIAAAVSRHKGSIIPQPQEVLGTNQINDCTLRVMGSLSGPLQGFNKEDHKSNYILVGCTAPHQNII